MLLQITHDTLYRYVPAVETAQHVACMRPRAHATQEVLDHALHINPAAVHRREVVDAFGNTRCFFALQTPHEVLQLVALSMVRTRKPTDAQSSIGWEDVRCNFEFHAAAAFDSAVEFVFSSRYAPQDTCFQNYARESFTAEAGLLKACVELMQRIHEDFVYESNSTEVHTTALQAFEQRKGVCQDFAHIMIACLRSLGLPARYVSGYLLTQPPPGEVKLIGSDASHAWASVYIPDLPDGERWCDFDPTNNRWGWHSPGEDYVTVAWGRDFADVSPLRGVIHGGASHILTVGVTVQRIDENPAPSARAVEGGPMPLPAMQTQSQGQSRGPDTAEFQTQTQSQDTI